jgi:proline dehydrogenase
MISFENTTVAFAGKNNSELKQAYWLFKLVSNARLVKFGKVATNAAISLKLPIKGLVKKTIFKQFCGGETIAECSRAITYLGAHNIGAILDYSIEGKHQIEDLDDTALEIIKTIEAASIDKHIPFAVFKLTGVTTFGLLKSWSDNSLTEQDLPRKERALKRVTSICAKAHELNVPVFIDAEESWIQPAIDEIALTLMRKYNTEKAIVYNTVQLYQVNQLDYIKRLLELAKRENFKLGLKLVRGAYMEKERYRAEQKGYPSPIQLNKADTDSDFNLALDFCLQNIDQIAICAGTHNEQSSIKQIELMTRYGISKNDNRVYFAQLYGMSDHISFNLADQGYNVAKYLPYGPIEEVLPYLIRRAEENTSAKGQTGRELGLINQELARRKKAKK